MRQLHRGTALALGLFLVLHFAHHLSLVAGTDIHLRGFDLLRPLYRAILIEPVLLALFALQIFLGLRLAQGRGWPHTGWGRLQTASGLYLAAFLLIHLGAIFAARLQDVDTNTHFAAAGLHSPRLRLFFAPYYTLAVAALFAHVASALYWRGVPHMRWLVGLGLIAGAVIVAGLMGAFGGPAPPLQHLEPLPL